MQIIPVIDLCGGLAVHAVAGERDKYRPVQRVGCRDGDALALVAFYAARNPPAIYIADLDAISGKDPQLKLWAEISSWTTVPLWIDCGISDAHSCRPFLEFESRSKTANRLILPTETLNGAKEVQRIIQQVNSAQLILSLDRKDGKPLAPGEVMDESALLGESQSVGIRKAIALDLASVGNGKAAERLDQWLPLLAQFPTFDWILGGGVSGARDLEVAQQHGFHGVLSATAILQGNL